MKMKRLLASVLALLLVVSLLPMTAMADNNKGEMPENTGEVNINYGTIETNGTSDGGPESGTVNNNKETIINNYGTVKINDEKTVSENPTISKNYGLVQTNNGTVTENMNGGDVTTNNGTVNANNNGGTVGKKDAGTGEIVAGTGNNGTVVTNSGTVISNNVGGTVGQKHENGNAVAGTGNNGTIETNSGTVISNNADGTVKTNAATGTIEVNNGLVGITVDADDPSFAEGTGNLGDIGINYGIVTINGENATVGTNYYWIVDNYGDVDTNYNWIEDNYGDVGTNDGMVYWNYGTVETNTINGKVCNKTTKDQNDQDVTGTVTNNYGTVYNLVPDNDGKLGYQATYGVEVKNTDGGAGTKLLQAVKNEIVKLADQFKRDGYELVGYNDITSEPEYPGGGWDGPVGYALNNNPSAQELSATDFQATRPSILSLIWKAIVKPAAPSGDPEPKTVRNNIPTTLSADQVKVGAYVRRGNLLFRIIEVGDDYIRVATVPKLSEKSLSDMLGFLKQHLSDAQIAKINGEPKLLEQELVTQFFGDTIDHISFYAAADLFE